MAEQLRGEPSVAELLLHERAERMPKAMGAVTGDPEAMRRLTPSRLRVARSSSTSPAFSRLTGTPSARTSSQPADRAHRTNSTSSATRLMGSLASASLSSARHGPIESIRTWSSNFQASCRTWAQRRASSRRSRDGHCKPTRRQNTPTSSCGDRANSRSDLDRPQRTRCAGALPMCRGRPSA